jgi:streptogramin lyase
MRKTGFLDQIVNACFRDIDLTRRVASPAILLGLVFLAGCMGSPGSFPGWAAYETSHQVMGVAFDRAGNLWAGGPQGAVEWQPDGRHVQFTRADGLVADPIWSVLVAPDGVVWFGTSGGVSRFDGSNWQSFTRSDGLADDQVWAMAASPDGMMWFGTNHGVSRFDGSSWQSYTSANGLINNVVQSIAIAPDGAVWFGTRGGASRFDGKTWQGFSKADGLAANNVWSIAAAPDGAMWFGTDGGEASRYDGSSWKNFDADCGLADNVIESIVTAPDGSLWFGGRNGVARFDGKAWQTYTPADALLKNNHILVWQQGWQRAALTWGETGTLLK